MDDKEKQKRAEEIKRILKVKEDYEANTLEQIANKLYEEHMRKYREKNLPDK